MKPSVLVLPFLSVVFAVSAFAQLPQGGVVQGGSVAITQPSATALQLTQGTERAAIDWQSFSIGSGHRVDIQQPGAGSILLNRVVGSAGSEILGQLNANGQVFLINPNGIVFGRGAQVNVGGLIASTLPLTGESATDGRLDFRGTGGVVRNAGAIKAAGGDVYLIGLQVANEGSVEAPNGSVGLAAGTTVTLRPASSDSLAVRFSVANDSGADAAATNSGAIAAVQAELRAAGGSATALAVNNTGIIQATGLREEGGRIFLEASGGTAANTGKLLANSAASTGGTIQVLGDHVKLGSGASLDASGATGGGTILVGGDYQGANAAIRNAQSTDVAQGVALRADATAAGDGGKVVLWADGATRYAGELSARGGAQSGHGGLAEVSGKGFLDFQGAADLSAPRGARGSLLLDPTNLTIGTVANVNGDGATGDDLPGTMNSAGDYGAVNSFITPAAITTLLNTTAVYLYASNDITVSSPVAYNSSQYLRIDAGRHIALNAAVTNAGTGEINFVAGSNIALAADASTGGSMFLLANGAITRTAGTVSGGFGVGFGGTGSAGTLAAPILTTTPNVFFHKSTSGSAFVSNSTATATYGNVAGSLTLTSNGAITNSNTLSVAGTTALAAGNGNDITLNSSNDFGGAVSITSARNVWLFDQNSIDFGASAITGTLLVDAGGAITDSGALVVNLAATLAAGSADITLDNVGTNFYSDVGLSTTGNATVRNSVYNLLVGSSAVSGNLNLTANGWIQQSAPITVGGVVTVATTLASSSISLGHSNNNLGSQVPVLGGTKTNILDLSWANENTAGKLPSLTGTTLRHLTLFMGAPVDLPALTLTGSLNVGLQNGAALTDSGILNIAGDTFLYSNGNGNITLNNNNVFGGSVTIANAGSATLVDTNSLVLGGANLTGSLNVTANGTITDTGALTVGGSTNLSSGGTNATANAITLDSAGNDFTGAVSAVGGNVTLVDTNALTLSNFNVFGATGITAGGAVSGSSLTLNGGAITVAAGGTNDVSLQGGLGTVAITSARDVSITTGGVVFGASTISGNLTTTSSGVSQTGAISVAGTTTLNPAGGPVSLGSANSFGGAVRVVNGGATTLVDGTSGIELGASTITGALNVTAAGHITQSGFLSVSGTTTASVTVANSDILLGGGTNYGSYTGGFVLGGTKANIRDLAWFSNLNTAIPSLTGTALRNLSLETPAAIDLPALTLTGNLYVGSYTGITDSGNLNIAGTTSLRSFIGSPITLNNSNNFGGAVSLNATGNVTLVDTGAIDFGASTVSGTFSVTSGGTITDSGNLAITGTTTLNSGAAAITLDSAGNNFGTISVTNSGDLTVVDANALTFGGAISGNANVTAGTTLVLNATQAARINAQTTNGNLTIAGVLSGSAPFEDAIILKAGTGTSAGTTTGGDVINNVGAGALSSPGSWRIYTGSTSGTTEGGLTSFTKRYNTASSYDPGAGGKYIFYREAPTITLTATGASRTYGAANPTLTGSAVGLIDGDTVAVFSGLTFTTTASASAGVGTAAVTGGVFSNPLNYTLAQAAGNSTALTINPATLTYTADPAARTYGSANPAFTGSVTGFVNSETAATATTGTLAFGSTATTTSPVGSYAINGSGLSATNYTFAQAAANATALTINPAVLTYTANAGSRTYGASNPSFTGSVTGFVNGENQAGATTGTLAFTSAATGTTGVGSHAINGSGLSATNYIFTQAAGNATALTINPATLTYTAGASSRTYGAANPAFTGSVTGFLNGETQASATTGTLVFGSTATGTSSVGSYAITGSGLSASNYTFTQAAGNSTALTIDPATLTYAANTASRTYGSANPAFTGSVTGFVNGENQAGATTGTLAFSSAATTASNVGTYAINGSGLGATNYTFTQAAGNATALTISPATLTYTANTAARIYGSANPAFTGSVTGFVNGENQAGATTGTLAFSSAATTASNVGSYAINGSGLGATNYTFIQAAGNATALTINPAALTYTANPASRTYGAANPAFTGSVTGFVNGENQAGATTGTLAFSSAATTTSNVGSYAINGSGLSATNYTFTQAAGNATALTINPATLTYTANTASRTYGAANPTFAGSVTGFVNGENQAGATTGTLAFSTAATTASNVGSYAISGSGLNASNYTFTQAAGNATALTINPATLAYTANPASRTYGSSNPTFSGTVTGFVNGETSATATTGTLTFSSAATATAGVGTYAIDGSGLNAGNYTFTQAAGNATALTINPATLTYTANTASRTYGATNPAFTGSVTGFVNGETMAGATTGSLSFNSTAGVSTGVGTYAIDGSGLSATNYTFTQAAGNATALTISPATLTYAADAGSRTYGSANPAFTGSVTGFVNGETLAVTTGTLAFSSSANTGTGVGGYAINGAGLSATNYIFTQAAGNATALTVSPAPLTYTANSVTRTYGAANPAFTGSVTGFVNGENQAGATTGTLAFNSAATTTTGVRSYAVNGSGLSAANYTFTQAAGNATALTVTPASLTYVANAASRTYGAANPTFTGSVTGFVNGETVAVTTGTLAFASAAGAGTGVGTSAINGSGLSAANYTFTQAATNATALTINPATLAYTANPVARTYGAANPAFNGSVTGFVNGETQAGATTGALVFNSAASATTGVGSYAVNGSGLSAANYTFTQAAGNATALTITPATLTYTANPASRNVGAANPAFSGTVTGFVNGETQGTATTGTVLFASLADATSVAGSYAINGAGLSAANYQFQQAAGNATALTITNNQGVLVYTANPFARLYGTANPVFSGTVTGFLGGDTLTSATSGTAIFTSTATATSGVGTYAILGSGLSSPSYTFAQAPSNFTALTISPATLTYTANAAARTYGAANPTFTGAVTGFVNGESLATATTGTVGFTSQAGPASNVGGHAISGSGLSAANYVFVQAAGNATALTINPAALTIAANDQEKFFGESDPALTYTLTGSLFNGDALTGALARAPGENVGHHAINRGTLSANANYVVSFVPGTLEIIATRNPAEDVLPGVISPGGARNADKLAPPTGATLLSHRLGGQPFDVVRYRTIGATPAAPAAAPAAVWIHMRENPIRLPAEFTVAGDEDTQD